MTDLTVVKEPDPVLENGDAFDEDTGNSVGSVCADNGIAMPVNISVFRDGYWYVYKVDRKYEHEEEPTA